MRVRCEALVGRGGGGELVKEWWLDREGPASARPRFLSGCRFGVGRGSIGERSVNVADEPEWGPSPDRTVSTPSSSTANWLRGRLVVGLWGTDLFLSAVSLVLDFLAWH